MRLPHFPLRFLRRRRYHTSEAQRLVGGVTWTVYTKTYRSRFARRLVIVDRWAVAEGLTRQMKEAA